MNNKITVMLASILVVMFSIVNLSEAQTVKNEGLNARQKGIVPIAAFTASGDHGEAENGPERRPGCRSDRQ